VPCAAKLNSISLPWTEISIRRAHHAKVPASSLYGSGPKKTGHQDAPFDRYYFDRCPRTSDGRQQLI